MAPHSSTARSVSSSSASSPPTALTTPTRTEAQTKRDFSTAAAEKVEQDPEKLHRLLQGFTHHDITKVWPHAMTWFVAPDQAVVATRHRAKAAAERPRLLPVTLGSGGGVTGSRQTGKEGKDKDAEDDGKELIEVEVVGQVPSPTATESDETVRLGESGSGSAGGGGNGGKGKKRKNKKKKKVRAIKASDLEVEGKEEVDEGGMGIDEQEVEVVLRSQDGRTEGKMRGGDGDDDDEQAQAESLELARSPTHSSLILDSDQPFASLPTHQEDDEYPLENDFDISSTTAEQQQQHTGPYIIGLSPDFSSEDLTEQERRQLITPTVTAMSRVSAASLLAKPQQSIMHSPVPSAPPTPPLDGSSIPQIIICTPTHNISRLPTPPAEMQLPKNPLHPLSSAWTLFYSDTSGKARAARRVSSSLPLSLGTISPISTTGQDYSSGLIPLFIAPTLEDFFGSWKALRRAIALSKNRPIEPEGVSVQPQTGGLGLHLMPDDTNFHLFADGIKPMWEDPRCAKGGKIMLAGELPPAMDHLFLEVCLLLIGGTIEDICPAPACAPAVTPARNTPQNKAKPEQIAKGASRICGAVISRRKLTRIEIWLGGGPNPDAEWVEKVTQFFGRTFPGFKIYGYKAFGK